MYIHPKRYLPQILSSTILVYANRKNYVPLQTDIATWLNKIELPEYTAMFHDAGYETEEDMVNLKKLNEKELRMMGISKRGEHF